MLQSWAVQMAIGEDDETDGGSSLLKTRTYIICIPMSHAVIGVFHVRLSATRIEPYKLVKQLVFTVSNLHSIQSHTALYD